MGTIDRARTRAKTRVGARLGVVLATIASAAAVSMITEGGATAADTPGGSISGHAYRDFDQDGSKDTVDPGLAGVNVAVTCVEDSGALASDPADDVYSALPQTTTTASDGSWSVVTTGGPCRIEFSLPAALNFLSPSAHGPDNATTVQFAAVGAMGVNVMYANPADYVGSANPELYGVMQLGGDVTDHIASANLLPSVWNWSYDEGEVIAGANGFSTVADAVATQNDTGSLFGAAAHKTSGTLLFSALVKRHAGLGDLGAAGVYAVDSVTNAPTDWADLAAFPYSIDFGTVPSNITRGLPHPGNSPSYDLAAYDLVGTSGIGGITVTEDDSALLVVNLFDKHVYRIGIKPNGTASDDPAIDLDTPTVICTNGEFRPYGVKAHDGQVYVGGVCDASGVNGTTAHLNAQVFSQPVGGGSWTQVLDAPLDYAKGCAITTVPIGCLGSTWNPWRPYQPANLHAEPIGDFSSGFYNFYRYVRPTPMLSDIEFDEAGNMIISMRDRTGDQYGINNYLPDAGDPRLVQGVAGGDLLKACRAAAGWKIEFNSKSAAVCASTFGPTTGAGTSQGPGGGEFFYQENYSVHQETSAGGLAYPLGSGTFASSALDPGAFNSGGSMVFDNGAGTTNPRTSPAAAPGMMLYSQPSTGQTSKEVPAFGKANGIGDVVILAELAPVEIGNRVWIDANANGVQDPGELPVADVTVTLRVAGNVVSAITDTNGNYYFSSAPGTSTPSDRYNVVALVGGAKFTVEVDPTIGVTPAVGHYDLVAGSNVTLTAPDLGSDTTDSDVVVVTGVSSTYTVGGPGQNNHTIDIGYVLTPTYSLGNYVWKDIGAGANYNNGRYNAPDAAEVPVDAVQVELLTSAGVSTGQFTATDATGYYRFDDLVAGSYRVRVTAANFALGGPLFGYLSSTLASSDFTDAGNDFDHGINNPAPATNGIQSGVVTLGVTNPLNDKDVRATSLNGQNGPSGNANDNLTVDFGFVTTIDLTITKTLTSGVGPYFAGNAVTYSLVVKNNGPATAMTGFTVTDKLPTGISFAAANPGTGTNWTCASPVGKEITCLYSGAALAAGSSATPITISAVVDTPVNLATVRRNVAYVAPNPNDIPETIPLGVPDPYENGNPVPDGANPSNNDDSAEITPASYDLALAKIANTVQVSANGDNIDWTIRVRNQGSVGSGDYVVTDKLPTGLTFVSCTPAVSCAAAAGIVTWTNPGALASGEFIDLTLRTSVADITKSPFRNWAEISADSGPDDDSTPDTDTGKDNTLPNDKYESKVLQDTTTDGAPGEANQTDSDDNDDATVGSPVYDLQLTKVFDSIDRDARRITWRLTVMNNGPDTAPGPVVVTDVLPATLSFISGGTSETPCAVAGQTVTCSNPGQMPVGSSISFVIVTGYTGTPDGVVNSATVAPGNGDSTPPNNASSSPVPSAQPVPAVTTTVPLTVPPGVPLPATGSDVFGLLIAGLMALGAGTAIVLVARRRRPTTPG